MAAAARFAFNLGKMAGKVTIETAKELGTRAGEYAIDHLPWPFPRPSPRPSPTSPPISTPDSSPTSPQNSSPPSPPPPSPPQLSPTAFPQLSPTDSPPDSPPDSPTDSPTDSPQLSPTESPTDSSQISPPDSRTPSTSTSLPSTSSTPPTAFDFPEEEIEYPDLHAPGPSSPVCTVILVLICITAFFFRIRTVNSFQAMSDYDCQIDHNVKRAMYENNAGLRFEEIVSADVWHDGVCVFSSFDLSSGELMGYAYLDLYSREEKYNQTCVLPLQNGSLSSNGARQVPVVLLMTQLLKEDIDSPVVLRFSEVVSLFHEFGHVAHHLCNHSSLARFSGLRVDLDLLEIPGHMFENWCYESSILKLISGYYQDITRPIKDDICTSIRRCRHSFSALKLMQEILYCLFDQIIYSADNVDLLEVFKFLHPKVMLGLPFLEGTNPASCFPHSAVGYEASCYSRIWSKVFAADLYASKFHDGILNHHIGMQFRNKVLAPGGAKDPLECLTNFLGREPSVQAFVDNIALSSV